MASFDENLVIEGVASHLVYEGNICETFPCWNDGICKPSNDSTDAFTCLCDHLFTGEHCQYRIGTLCLNGKCTPGTFCTVNGQTVKCPSDFISEFLSSCVANTCVNGGQCVEAPHGSRCYCPPPFHGPFCQFEGSAVEVEWSTVEILLLCLLVAMVMSSFALVCYSGNLGCYIFVPAKHYSRWNDSDVTEDDDDQTIALGELSKPNLRISQTTETMMEGEAPSSSSTSRNGVVDL